MFYDGLSLHVSRVGKEPVKIGSRGLKTEWLDGHWFGGLGNSIFKIDTTPYPSIALSTNKSTYGPGETVTLTKFRFTNPDSQSAVVEAKIWLDLPNAEPVSILDIAPTIYDLMGVGDGVGCDAVRGSSLVTHFRSGGRAEERRVA